MLGVEWSLGKDPRGAGAQIRNPGGLKLEKLGRGGVRLQEGEGRRLQQGEVAPPSGSVSGAFESSYATGSDLETARQALETLPCDRRMRSLI